MKPALLITFLLASLATNAQHTTRNLPLAIEDAGMDAYLQNRKVATLVIQINHAPDSAKKTEIKYSLVAFGADFQNTEYTQSDASGLAKIILDQNQPYQQIWLSVGDYLYAGIYVNTGLTVTIDAAKISKEGVYMLGDGVEYSGDDGQFNTVMNKHVLFKKEEQDLLANRLSSLCTSRKKYPEELFLKKIDSISLALSQIDNEFIDQFPRYGWAVKNETASQLYGDLCVSYWWNLMPKSLFEKVNHHQPFFTSNNGVLFYKYLADYILYKKDNPLHLFDENRLLANYDKYDPERKALLDSINDYRKTADGVRDKDSASLMRLYKKRNNLFAQEIEASKVEDYIKIIDGIYPPPKSDILKTCLLDKGKDAFAQTFPEILNGTETGWCRRIIAGGLANATVKQKKIDSLLASGERLENSDGFIGKPLERLPFDARLYRLDSVKNAGDWVVNLKSKFRDKILIIDFWATWCAPCLQDLPFSKKLHEANGDLPIAYIYICTNSSSNVTLWKNKIAALKLPGTHIFMEEKMVADLKRFFNRAGSGFPTYVVIEAGGKLSSKTIQMMQYVDREKLKSL